MATSQRDELHRVVDRHAGGDRAARAVDVQPDVAVQVLALEVEELGADLVGDVVVDGRAEEDHPVAQEAVEDVGAGIERRLEHLGREGRQALGHGRAGYPGFLQSGSARHAGRSDCRRREVSGRRR